MRCWDVPMRRRFLLAAVAGMAGSTLGVDFSAIAEPVSFKGKTVTMTVAYAAGGGTDLTGRLIAPYLTKFLSGNPTVVVQNMPGASGTRAMNHIVQRTQPDGLTILMGAASGVDPVMYRTANVQYKPEDFRIIGGFGRGGLALLINAASENRLLDRSKAPLAMGGVTAHDIFSRSGMALWGIEYLGWNAKWVLGYAGTNETVIALERGEVDMVSTGDLAKIRALVNSGRAKLLTQSALRADFPDVPIFADQVEGKIADPLPKQAFAYWRSYNEMDKWLGLAPGTADDIVAAYQMAFDRIAQDAEFIEQGRKMSQDFELQPADLVSRVVQVLAGTPNEAIDHIKSIARKQGLEMR
jgi:tripartite-type tricarboxylate transporter receptor subunit TctC